MDELIAGTMPDTRAIAAREGCSERAARMILMLAFLSPKIVQAAIDGTLPRGVGVSRLTDLSPDWDVQWRTIQSSVVTINHQAPVHGVAQARAVETHGLPHPQSGAP